MFRDYISEGLTVRRGWDMGQQYLSRGKPLQHTKAIVSVLIISGLVFSGKPEGGGLFKGRRGDKRKRLREQHDRLSPKARRATK